MPSATGNNWHHTRNPVTKTCFTFLRHTHYEPLVFFFFLFLHILKWFLDNKRADSREIIDSRPWSKSEYTMEMMVNKPDRGIHSEFSKSRLAINQFKYIEQLAWWIMQILHFRLLYVPKLHDDHSIVEVLILRNASSNAYAPYNYIRSVYFFKLKFDSNSVSCDLKKKTFTQKNVGNKMHTSLGELLSNDFA